MMAKSPNPSILACVSLLAMAAAFTSPSARAQTAFQGSYTVEPGGIGPTITRGTTDTIVLNDAETVINWRPTDTSGTGEIDFLPSNRTALFTNSISGVSDFTVLNRILPIDASGVQVSRVVALNGTVQSQISGNPGGKVWFYAPGGIVAGPSSVFSVGSLVLTSNDIDTTGGLYANGDTIRFRGASNVLSSVEVKSGAQISALSAGSYVALVAPRVVQGGTVMVNGTAAYVGAEQADIRINGGLFDISISVGTTDQNGVVHSGSTDRVDRATSAEAQRVYMVAAPKNNVLTMLLSGNVGYNAADSVVQDGSAVILAAGQDVFGSSIGSASTGATGASNISIGASTWQPSVTGAATNAITLRANQGETITAGGDMSLTAGSGAVGGRIDLLTFGGSGSTATDGQIAVTGNLTLDAIGNGDAGVSSPPLTGADATGGTINLIAAGGMIQAASLTANVSAAGGSGSDFSGNAQGGAISLSAQASAGPGGTASGALTFGGVTLDASARGAYGQYYSSTIDSGNAVGGTISVEALGGAFTAGSLFANASGSAGDASGVAGNGLGGNISLSAGAAGGLRGSFSLADCARAFCQVRADGAGARGANGSNGTGGSILVHASDADFSALGELTLQADGSGGGAATDGFAGRGGDGFGGSVTVESRLGTAGTGVMTFGDLILSAVGSSAPSIDGVFYNGGDAGNGTGGTINLSVLGGTLTADVLETRATGLGGAAASNCPICEGGGTTSFQAGSGTGGTSQFLISGGSATIGTLILSATGTGGEAAGADTSFDPQSVAALAGTGQGGAALLESQGGTLQLGTLAVDASGTGGAGALVFQEDGADGGIGRGGNAGLSMTTGSGGQILVDGGVIVQALGKGGIGGGTGSDGPGTYRAGRGGTGTGGTADVTLAGGTLTAPSLLVSADATGGAGGDNGSDGAGGDAGNGTGGTARLAYLNEGHRIGDVSVTADGLGGQAGSNRFIAGFDNNGNPIYDGTGPGGAGGAGLGGSADMLVDVDPVFTNLTVSADGIGSVGGSGGTGSAGGAGTGGVAALNLAFGATTVSGLLKVTASGVGGLGGTGYDNVGGRGGDATGGSATFGLSGTTTTLDAGNISVLAQALGGAGGTGGLRSGTALNGADGGNALGGTAMFALSAGATAVTGVSLQVSGNATGGAGAPGTAGPVGGNGGAGGNALAGSATLRISDAHIAFSSGLPKAPGYSITAVGQGGAGADGSAGTNAGLTGGAGGRGGDGSGGLAAFDAGNGDYLLGGLTLLADGLGGFGGAGGIGPAGASAAGATGLGTGGTVDFANGDGGLMMPGAVRQLDSLYMSASGDIGGRVQFAESSTAANGGLRVNGSIALASLGAPVSGFSGIYAGAAANAVQIGGNADFTSDGPLSFAFTGMGSISAGGALTASSATRIDLSHGGRPAGSDSLIADMILFNTPGDISLLSAGSLRAISELRMLSSGGNINLASGSQLSSGGDLRLFAQGSLNGAGATVRAAGSVAIGLGAGGDIVLGNLLSGGLLDQADASGNALGAGGLSTGGNFAVGGQLSIGPGSGTISAATISIGNLTADSQQLTATGGAVQIGNATMTGGLTVTGQGISAGQMLVGGQSLLNAGTGSLTVSDIVSIGPITATGGTINLGSTGAMTIAQANASGGPLILNAAGALAITQAISGGAMTLNGATIDATALDAVGTVTAIAAGDARFGDVSSQTGDMVLTAGGTATLSGTASARAITVGSGDIVIGPAALVGTPTATITFNAINTLRPAYVGGNDVAGSYSLSAVELARVLAGNLTISAARQAVPGSPDLIVQNLTLGTGNLAAGGVLTLATAGRLRVQGALALTGRSGQGGVTLTAGEVLEIIAGAGSIDVSDANGGLGGVMMLGSPSIIAATLSAMADVRATSSLQARELRLAQNDGLMIDVGLLRAGVIRANVTDGFFIQNIGLSTDFSARRGFTAQDLLISTQGLTPIAINGQLLLPTGAFATGRDVIPLVAINGVRGGRAGGYAPDSKINGCLIASAGACVTPGFDSRDTWNGVLDPSVAVGRIFTLSLIELRDIIAQGYPPLIDEPVTGAGNEDLWERHCGGPDEPACSDGGTH
ncbi:histidine kinase [Sphingobium sp. Sx8-8]|uniref:beta strand repeat-containing protein n=1 Tax=Sphingobium sp. Sx8-8 TaxID=2933617 RepID=UPI001F5A2E7A|nr:histidine kinase [Sphingobium sp. Sx8-8]